MADESPIPPKLLEALRRGGLFDNIRLLREIGVRGREARHYLWEAFKAGRLRGADAAAGDQTFSPGQVGGGARRLGWALVLAVLAVTIAVYFFWRY